MGAGRSLDKARGARVESTFPQLSHGRSHAHDCRGLGKTITYMLAKIEGRRRGWQRMRWSTRLTWLWPLLSIQSGSRDQH